jgi:starvation-inducible DNA-binding protein
MSKKSKNVLAIEPATTSGNPIAEAAAQAAATPIPSAPAGGAPRIDIGISDKDRADVAAGLSKVLADSFTLYLNTHRFHWNVTGPLFNTLHLMFETQYTELWGAIDPLAERIRALGHYAPGTYAEYTALSSIDQPEAIPEALEMVRLLVKGHEAVAKTGRQIIDVADKANDQPTADLLTERLNYHEKTAWMLRSLLQ